MTKSEIIGEIQRTTEENGGVPLGRNRFEQATGVRRSDWFGVHWARWGDAVREAGFEANQLQSAYDKEELLLKYAAMAKELNRLPTSGELLMRRRNDTDFPNAKTFESRLGKKVEMIREFAEFCRNRSGFEDVASLCDAYVVTRQGASGDESSNAQESTGFVYLIRHGTRREYKIGRTNNSLRREGEVAIELPEMVSPIHVIRTDDPAGVEAYWHRRFAEKRLNGEWFALSVDDVRAFKRWRRIH